MSSSVKIGDRVQYKDSTGARGFLVGVEIGTEYPFVIKWDDGSEGNYKGNYLIPETVKEESMMTNVSECEKEIFYQLRRIAEKFKAMPEECESDCDDFYFHIRAAQNVLLARAGFRALGDKEK